MDLGKVNGKPSGKHSPFSTPLRTFVIHEKRSNTNINRGLKEANSLMDDLKGFKPILEEVAEDMVKISRKPQLEAEPEDVTD